MSKNSKIFRSQIGGFNRDDVNNYIKESDMKYAEEISAARADADELRTKLDEAVRNAEETALAKSAADELVQKLEAEVSAKDEKICELIELLDKKRAEIDAMFQEHSSALDSVNTQLNAVKAEKEDLSAKLASCTSELEAVRAVISDRDAEISRLKIEIEEKSALIPIQEEKEDVPKNDKTAEELNDRDSDTYKLNMYNKVSSQLGDIIINANRNADDIISAAKEEAEQIRTETAAECEQKRAECDAAIAKIKHETETEASCIRDRLSHTATDLISRVSADLHTNIENCVRELNACVTDMQYEVKSLAARFAARSSEMDDKISYYQGCVSDDVNKHLNSMDEKYGIRKLGGDGGIS